MFRHAQENADIVQLTCSAAAGPFDTGRFEVVVGRLTDRFAGPAGLSKATASLPAPTIRNTCRKRVRRNLDDHASTVSS